MTADHGVAVLTAITTPWSIFTSPLLESALAHLTYKTPLVWAAVSFPLVIVLIIWWRWISRRDARQKQIEELGEATRIREAISTERLLVIRAVDDEAYLLIALGTIFSYVFATSIVFVIAVLSVVPFFAESVLPILHLFHKPALHPGWDRHTFQLACSVIIIALFAGLIISRVVHGHELARSPMIVKSTHNRPQTALV